MNRRNENVPKREKVLTDENFLRNATHPGFASLRRQNFPLLHVFTTVVNLPATLPALENTSRITMDTSQQRSLTNAERMKDYKDEDTARQYARRHFPTVHVHIILTRGDKVRISRHNMHVFSYETVLYRGLGCDA